MMRSQITLQCRWYYDFCDDDSLTVQRLIVIGQRNELLLNIKQTLTLLRVHLPSTVFFFHMRGVLRRISFKPIRAIFCLSSTTWHFVPVFSHRQFFCSLDSFCRTVNHAPDTCRLPVSAVGSCRCVKIESKLHSQMSLEIPKMNAECQLDGTPPAAAGSMPISGGITKVSSSFEHIWIGIISRKK